ncbi:MAG: DUF971 domain-containing protein [Pseudomonadota bacterium]
MQPEALSANAEHLHIQWADGTSATYPAHELRGAARDATSQRELYDTGTIDISEGLEITGVDYVGAYGLNIRFSDGHERAIYPFVYLRELRGLETS